VGARPIGRSAPRDFQARPKIRKTAPDLSSVFYARWINPTSFIPEKFIDRLEGRRKRRVADDFLKTRIIRNHPKLDLVSELRQLGRRAIVNAHAR
jgi:hypothetical protein